MKTRWEAHKTRYREDEGGGGRHAEVALSCTPSLTITPPHLLLSATAAVDVSSHTRGVHPRTGRGRPAASAAATADAEPPPLSNMRPHTVHPGDCHKAGGLGHPYTLTKQKLYGTAPG